MFRFMMVVCLIGCLACSRRAILDTSGHDTGSQYSANELSAKMQSVESDKYPPPKEWRKDAGRVITFIGLRAPSFKGPYQGVKVGEHVLDVRGGALYDVPEGSKVRVTGVLQLIRHPGDPYVVMQQGQAGSREPWNEWFVDATKVEVLSKPD